MQIELDPDLFRFEPEGTHAHRIYYRDLFVMTQHYNDPDCPRERQRALAVAKSVLEFRWERASHHERLAFIAATKLP